jgi:hypothetical protein
MAYWGNVNRTSRMQPDTIIKPGDGINTYLPPTEIARSEAVSMLNMINTNYPSLSVRPGRVYYTISSAAPSTANNSLGMRGTTNANYLHVHDNLTWKYWATSDAFVNVCTSGINATSKFIEFNTESARYTCLCGSSYLKYWDGTTLAASTAAPQTSLYAIDDYRLYNLNGSVLKCSAAGSITDWTTADDADSIAITSMKGVGTAICAYNDMIICWGEQTMHILYGDDPGNFTLADPIMNGCISNRSVIIYNGILYFMDFYKFMMFTGGTPVEISQKAKTYLDNINYTYKSGIVSMPVGKYILISIPYGSSATANNLTLVYDTEYQKWYVWNLGFKDYTVMGEYTYAVDTSGYIWKLNTGTDDDGTAISWEVSFGVWNALPSRPRKVISDIWAIVDLPATSTMTVYYSTSFDSTSDWTSLYSFTGSADGQNTRIKIPTSILQGVTWYRIKISGTGPATIHYLEPYLRVKER